MQDVILAGTEQRDRLTFFNHLRPNGRIHDLPSTA